jgi:hypothetical protein
MLFRVWGWVVVFRKRATHGDDICVMEKEVAEKVELIINYCIY